MPFYGIPRNSLNKVRLLMLRQKIGLWSRTSGLIIPSFYVAYGQEAVF